MTNSLNALFGKKPTEDKPQSVGGLNALKGLATSKTATDTTSQNSEVQPAVKAEPAKAAANGGFKLGGFKTPAAQAPVPAATQAPAVEPEVELSLADLESSMEQGERPTGLVAAFSGFSDEVPAQEVLTIARTLPEDMTPQMAQFVSLMDGVYEIVNDVDLVGNVIKSIMIELKSNPQYIKLVAPDDIRQWIRLMRENMGLARIQKAEKKAKTASRKSSKVADEDMLADLASLGLVIE